MSKCVKFLSYFSVTTFVTTLLHINIVYAAPDNMIFPVVGNTNYSDTFLAYRAGQVDNKHHAIDIFGAKHSYLVSPVDGTVRYVGYPEDSWGWYVVIVDKDGYEYHFMHINNDTPGTDDGVGGPMNAYAPDMRGEYNVGAAKATPVVRGQHIAYLGDSGNAENTPSHLHFEIIRPEYTSYNYRDIPLNGFVNPFPYLNAATHIAAPVLYPALPNELLPYGPGVNSQVNVAEGNFNADSDQELVTGAGPGGGPHVRLFDKNGTFLNKEFMAFSPNFMGGVDVASCDFNGDGQSEIVVGAGRGGGPHVRILNQDGTQVGGFYAYAPNFAGGVRVACGDIDGDGKPEIVTGILSGGGPHVRVFRQDGSLVSEFMAYAQSFSGGVDVAVGDVNNDGKQEIITGAGPGGGTHVRVLDYTGKELSAFMAYPGFGGGVRVSAGNADLNNPKDEIVTAPWSGGGPNIIVYKSDGTIVKNSIYMEEWWSGVYDVAAGNGNVKVGTGYNRRTSVRDAF